MNEKIKAITFDLDDTFWDVKPVLINAEMKTRKFIEDKIGKLEWGSWEEFKLIREKLIVEDASYEFDVGKLRKKSVSYTHLRAHEDQRGSRMPSSA